MSTESVPIMLSYQDALILKQLCEAAQSRGAVMLSESPHITKVWTSLTNALKKHPSTIASINERIRKGQPVDPNLVDNSPPSQPAPVTQSQPATATQPPPLTVQPQQASINQIQTSGQPQHFNQPQQPYYNQHAPPPPGNHPHPPMVGRYGPV